MFGYEPKVLKPIELPAASGRHGDRTHRIRLVETVQAPAYSPPSVGPDGFEPPSPECRTGALPLDDGPVVRVLGIAPRSRAPEARALLA